MKQIDLISKKKIIVILDLIVLVIGGGLAIAPLSPVSAVPTGKYFDNIVIIAMENQLYSDVLGTGTGSSNAPFISTLLPYGATIPNFHGYGANGRSINGCSAGCYLALTGGSDFGQGDGYCSTSSAPCLTNTNIITRLTSAGLTWQTYCESGCPRGADHYPYIAYSNTYNSPNSFWSSSVSTSSFISAANSATPANLLWFTPTDNNNMHDNSISSGDSYIKTFLVGSGSLSSPSSNSLFASKLFQSGHRTLFIVWWDEYDPAPIIFYGSMVKQGFISSSDSFDHYSILRMIEDNWNLATLTSNDGAATGLANEIFGSSSPASLKTSFVYSPPNPTNGSQITFTSSVSGGVTPYTYSWNFGDGTTSTNSNPTHTYLTIGNFTVNLTVKDSANSAVIFSRIVSVTKSSTSTNPSVPILIGWGGVRLDEASVGGGGTQPTNPPSSAVFPGETMTNMELLLIELKAMGYNTVRVDFDPYCANSQDMSTYNAANLQRAIEIAQYYGFWIIVDYHGYSDMFNTSTSACWLNFWASVTNQFKNSYSQIIWEPLNEPCYGSGCPDTISNNMCSGASACVSVMSHEYQLWINQTRNQGDTHWIVVQNICSYGCSLNNWADGYPIVTDPLGQLPLGKIFISLHSYMGYSSSNWNNSTAEALAQQNYQTVVAGVASTGWPALNTEGGADPLCTNCAPDQILTGSAGYTTTTLHFIQTLTDLYDTNTPQRINWIWWPAGSWTDTPNAGIYGAMQCNSNPPGWGCLLKFKNLPESVPDFKIVVVSPLNASAGTTTVSTLVVSYLAGFSGTVNLSVTVPQGLSCSSLSKSSVNHNDNVTISCTSTSPGTHVLTVTGTSGTLAHSVAVPFTYSTATPPPPSSSSGGGGIICLNCLLTNQWWILLAILIIGGIIGMDLSLVVHHHKLRTKLSRVRGHSD